MGAYRRCPGSWPRPAAEDGDLIVGLAAPWEKPSLAGINYQPVCEVLTAGCLKPRKVVYATVNHRRAKRHRLGSTKDGKLRLLWSDRGLFFELDTPLPADIFTGVSVGMRVLEYRREADLLFRVLSAELRHISLLTEPHRPAYRTWVMETTRAASTVDAAQSQ
jgi:hypothetical protein